MGRAHVNRPDTRWRIRQALASTSQNSIYTVNSYAEFCLNQPSLLQQRDQWKRPGLYFDNLHKYKALPADANLIGRGKAVVETLLKIPKVFADTVKGVKLASAVAKEISTWVTFAEPLLLKAVTDTNGAGEHVVDRGDTRDKKSRKAEDERSASVSFAIRFLDSGPQTTRVPKSEERR